MPASELKLLLNLRSISRYSIVLGIFISVLVKSFGVFPLELQVSLALMALAVGIPHGAVDHLVTVPRLAGFKMVAFIAAYLGVVAIAVACILSQNTLGFQVVVVMSAVHFGIGDAAFVREIDKRRQEKRRFPRFAYALAAGFVPVLIPLVNSQSTQALLRVNPKLVDWVGPFESTFLFGMVAVAVICVAWMLVSRRWQEALDLLLLTVLALVAPPLVAFALYFGLWHAVRHTGRLTLELDSAKKQHAQGKGGSAFMKAFAAGLPALVITVAGAVVLDWSRGFALGQDLLWYLLVVVWALTVPHMALTARMDAKALA